MRRLIALTIACVSTACFQQGSAVVDEHAGHSTDASASNAASVSQPGLGLPAGADGAASRLQSSPRHGEWVVIRTSPTDSVSAWVVYPERSTKAPVVVVIHEIFGLSTWVRAVADQLAADGFIAIAPDLLTMKRTSNLTSEWAADSARAVIGSLDRDNVHRDILAVANYGMALPAATQKYGVVGYCWGGSTVFEHAIVSPGLGASVVYYGGSPASERMTSIHAPILGLYGGNDARVNATIPRADSTMKALGKSYEAHIFEGAGHGFLRNQGGSADNLDATRRAWPLTVAFFKKHLDT